MRRKLSREAVELWDKRFGYRNDSIGSGYYKVYDIVMYELQELGNEDIIRTCRLLYYVDDPFEVLLRYFGGWQNVWGLWLARKEDVLKYYVGEDVGKVELSVYRIPEDAIILSDLGAEGVLFVFRSSPESLYVRSELEILS